MSSVKKTDKSRKAKATIARAALKSRTTAAKTSKSSAAKSSAAKTRPVRAKTRTAAPAARAVTKTKTARKPVSAASKSAAAKLRAAQARAKKQATAAKAARPAAKSAVAKSAAATRKAKTNQNAAAAKLKRSTNVSRGKSRAGRNAPVEAKLHKAVTTVQQPAAPQTKPEAVVKKVDSERRAQVAAVLALRSLRKPAPAAEPVARPEASKVSVTQKAPKKAAEAAPAPTRVVAAPVAPKAVAPSAPEPVADVKPAAPLVEKPKPAKPAAPVKHGFKPLEFVVYPAHGVGQILAVEEQEVAGFKLELFVISFSKDKMILKVPTPKSIAVGMRKLAGPEVVKHALNTLTGRARIKRTMWSRRAQEYEAKINSGDLVAIAEVVRDLYRSDAQPEQSYSERQLYEAALDRVAREIAAVQKLTETEALKVIESQLQKSPRRGKADEAEADAEVETEASDDSGIDEAA
ncbi:CarD family transcriptional regulator [Methylovirgula ligni]|uniref:CarD family transcriptional regulator n=1 Tax=Methylovirgula ligni TaxID=569860 RepID=A0A3D9ZDT8_9HYPH|nr:CarD family transcriptional regulator [Methylovirgula ligni]REF89636.1 CarD family transcriptional regulator [Methylovirgula ligni]